jgi:hypothetical protein
MMTGFFYRVPDLAANLKMLAPADMLATTTN